ncbi:MAG: dethiobiotin synthase [Pseudomonadota bacterium]
MQISSCVVLGTDTDAGKTYTSVRLLNHANQQGQRAIGMKPVATGWNMNMPPESQDDVAALREASVSPLPKVSDQCPYLFSPPVSPHLAARQAGIMIDPAVIQQAYSRLQKQADCIIVESAGGVLSPLNDNLDMVDLPALLGLPGLLIIDMRVGCINQGRLAAEALQHRNVPMLGWIANYRASTPIAFQEEILATLKQSIPFPYLEF